MKYFVFAVLCVCTFAGSITPHVDCASVYDYYRNNSGDIYFAHVYEMVNGCDYNMHREGWRISSSVNKTFIEIDRSDLDSFRCASLSVTREGEECEEDSLIYNPLPFYYESGPVPDKCPDGSSGCKRYSDGSKYILVDSKNRLVRSEYGELYVYYDDQEPTLSMFALTLCNGTEIPAPTVDLCENISSESSSKGSNSGSPSSASMATIGTTIVVIAAFIAALL